MKTKRTVPRLLAVVSLLGLLTSACYDDYYYRHHRHYRGGYYRSSVELRVDGERSAQTGVTAR